MEALVLLVLVSAVVCILLMGIVCIFFIAFRVVDFPEELAPSWLKRFWNRGQIERVYNLHQINTRALVMLVESQVLENLTPEHGKAYGFRE